MRKYKFQAACKTLNKDAPDTVCGFSLKHLTQNPYNNLINEPTYGVEHDTEKGNIECNSAKYLLIFSKVSGPMVNKNYSMGHIMKHIEKTIKKL